MKKLLTALTGIILIISIALICGCDEDIRDVGGYQKACDALQISINEKTNTGDEWGDVIVTFRYVFKNPSPYTITDVIGNMTIEDCNGKALSSGEASFSGSFDTNVEKVFTLDWRMDDDGTAARIWNSELDALKISFKITEVYFEDDYTAFEPKYENKVIKPVNFDYLNAKYNAANGHLDKGEYDKAIELYEAIVEYKDCATKAESAKRLRDEAAAIASKETYNSALNAITRNKYAEAVKLLLTIPDYSETPAKIEELKLHAEEYGVNMMMAGDYLGVVEFLTALGYSDDYWTEVETPETIRTLIIINRDAAEGIYSGIVSLGLTEFKIPEGVTSIAPNAFEDCNTLQRVTIPDSVTSIGGYAFSGCTALQGVNIPKGVTFIGAGAFQNCTALSEVTLPDGLTTLEACAFAGCTSLNKMDLPTNLRTIGIDAFYGCKGIRTLTIPKSVTSIGDNALSECDNLTELFLPAIGGLQIQDLFYYSMPSSLVRITVTSGSTLTARFFAGCTVTEIVLPNGLTTIGTEAFKECTATKINIPATLTEIGESAFEYSYLTEVTLPSGVTKISNRLFANSAIKKLNLHRGITDIGIEVFYNCEVVINYPGTRADWEMISKDSLWDYYISDHKIVCSNGTYTCLYGQGSWS